MAVKSKSIFQKCPLFKEKTDLQKDIWEYIIEIRHIGECHIYLQLKTTDIYRLLSDGFGRVVSHVMCILYLHLYVYIYILTRHTFPN